MSKKFWFYFNAAVASLASAVTLFCAFAPVHWYDSRTWCATVIILVIIGAICWLYGLAQTEEKDKITLKVSPGLRVNIFSGDLFGQKDIVVIPVNEYFDTRCDNVIIDKKTVHGQFIEKYFHGNEDALYHAIEGALQGVPYEEDLTRIHDGARQKKYEIGTCADVVIGNTTYVLFALTHFDCDDKAYLPREEFAGAIKRLMEHVAHIAGNKPVYMPLLGTGLARLNQSHQRILLYIVDTIDFSCPVTISAGLNIVVYHGDMKKVNLNKVEEFYNDTFHDIEL